MPMNSSSLVRLLPTRWGVCTALIVLVAAGALKWNAGLMPRGVSIPDPLPPVRNARDYYDRAEASLRDKGLVTQQFGVFWRNAASKVSDYAVRTSPLDRHLVAENRPALAILRQGMRYAYQAPRGKLFDDGSMKRRNDAYLPPLLGLQSRMQAASGDWSGAMSSDLDGIAFGLSLREQAPADELFESSDREQVGRSLAWKTVDHLTSPQAKAAARRLGEILSRPTPFSDALEQEKWLMQASYLETFRQQGWRDAITDTDGASPPIPISIVLYVHLHSPRDFYDAYTTEEDEAIRRSKLTWAAERALPPQKTTNDVLMAFTDLSWLQCHDNDDDALNRMLLIKLALRACRLDHGAYPADLEALTPNYLLSVPRDPFSDGQPMRYKLANGQPLVYSIGPDAVDNGGRPILIPKKRGGGINHFPTASSTGDLPAPAGG